MQGKQNCSGTRRHPEVPSACRNHGNSFTARSRGILQWQDWTGFSQRHKRSRSGQSRILGWLKAKQSHIYVSCLFSGGTLEMDDLRSFQVREEDAWKLSLGNTRMYIPPPPAGGALLAFILKLMTGFWI